MIRGCVSGMEREQIMVDSLTMNHRDHNALCHSRMLIHHHPNVKKT